VTGPKSKLKNLARYFLPLGAAALLLHACAVTPPKSLPELTPAQQQAFLHELPGYSLDGRVGVRAGDKGWQANVNWQQRGDVSEVRLSGPFGAGALRLRLQGDALQMTDSRGHQLQGEEATNALREQLGFMPPLTSLRDWLLGLPDASQTPAEAADGGAVAIEFQQQDWHLRYDDFRDEPTSRGKVRVPGKLTATRGDIRLRLVVDRWRLRTAD
jgi:outer membrane lipoprotein LolB